MLDEVCAYLHNYFDRDLPKYFGEIVIAGGELVGFSDKLQVGQYFRIVGSVFNDGVYKYPATDLTDETFDNGAVWAMAIPKGLLDVVADIEAWQAKYGGADSAAMSPFNSESFGGYSYSKSSGSATGSATNNPNAWQSVFAARLARWKKIV
jgi:hypothetical protein